MKLGPGTRLGQYEILSSIGAGGMGEVWKARDTTLDREVAIKVLPEAFADDPDRRSRFEREAKTLASLNHPGIAVIHGLHEQDGTHFLAMELVPGEDLARRLSDGPLPIDEALRVAFQVAEALEAAHAQGIVHRDLKPANIVLTPDGKAKVLDFGLAKAFDTEAASASGASLSPTVTSAGTLVGMILGTAAYMSPEQARGKPLDKRSDIWSFGCVLYECLTARSQFRGESVSDSVGAILHKEPDWLQLPPGTPPTIRLLLNRCLTKDRDSRLHDIADARVELQHAIYDPTGAGADLGDTVVAETGAAWWSRPWALAVLVLAGLGVGIAGGWLLRGEPVEEGVRKLDLGVELQSGAGGDVEAVISPDGTRVAFIREGKVWVQALDRLEPRELDGTDGAEALFWSPDSAQLGYFQATKLWKVPVAGGDPVAICDTGGNIAGGRGASWGEDGRIVFSRGSTGLLEVAALGGEPRELLPVAENERDLHEPRVLPGGRGILFVAHPEDRQPGVLWLLAGGERRLLLDTAADQRVWTPTYEPGGHILMRRRGGDITSGLWALPFSLADLEVRGEPFLVVPDASAGSVSRDGTLVFVHRPPATGLERLVWLDGRGVRIEEIGGGRSLASFPALSPNGRRLAFVTSDEDGQSDLWVRDLERGTETRLSSDDHFEFGVYWSPSGDEIVFNHFEEDIGVAILIVPSDGSAAPRKLREGAVSDFGHDAGHVILMSGEEGPDDPPGPSGAVDIWLVSLDGSEEPRPLIRGKSRDLNGRVSPNNRFLAFESNRSGRDEIYIARFPEGSGRWQVSVNGGEQPQWDSRGDRLYYREESRLMQVSVEGEDAPGLGKPSLLLDLPELPRGSRGYAVAPGAERVVVTEPVEPAATSTRRSGIKVVHNWAAEFAR